MTRLTTGLVAVLLAFGVTACGNDSGSGSTNTSSDSTSTSEETSSGGGDAVAWADEVCSGIKDEVAALTTTPELDQSNPQAATDGLVTYLGSLEGSLDGMASAVEGAGTPPVDGGEEAVKSFLDQIGTAKESVTSAKSKIEAAPVDDPAAFQSAAAAAVQDLQALSSMDPTSAFSDNDELNAAYNDAASCQELESGSSSPTT
jgi:hypothetical protein